MKPRTYNAPTIQEAVDQIRKELGPDALVLGVRQLEPSGVARLWKKPSVEVVASAAVPESPAPQVDPLSVLRQEIADLRRDIDNRAVPLPVETARRKPAPSNDPLQEVLIEAGLEAAFAAQIQSRTQTLNRDSKEGISESLKRALLEYWRRPEPGSISGSNVHVFIGPPGTGKTTCLAKRLAQVTLLEGCAARVYRLDGTTANAGLFLDLHCEVLGVPVHRHWSGENAPSRDEIAFIDLPGFSPLDRDSVTKVQAILRMLPNARVHLVLNAAYESSLLLAQARDFAALPVTDLVLTHLDEERRWGKMWNLVMGTKFTISWLGSGQNIPGELSLAVPERIISAHVFDHKGVAEPLGVS